MLVFFFKLSEDNLIFCLDYLIACSDNLISYSQNLISRSDNLDCNKYVSANQGV